MKMRGRNGVLMWVALLIYNLALAGPIIFMRDKFDSVGIIWLAGVICVIGDIFIIWCMIRNYIRITETKLEIAIGCITQKIDIQSIDAVKKVNSLVASVAASYKRIEIQYGNQIIYISPKDRDEFIRYICKVNNKINVL